MEYEPNGPMYHAGQPPPPGHHMVPHPGHAYGPPPPVEGPPQMVTVRQAPPMELRRVPSGPGGPFPAQGMPAVTAPGQGYPAAMPGGPGPGAPATLTPNGPMTGAYQRAVVENWYGKYHPASGALSVRGEVKPEDGPRGVPVQDWPRDPEEARRRPQMVHRDRGHERRAALYTMIRQQTQANMEMRDREEVLLQRRSQLKQQYDVLCAEIEDLRARSSGPRRRGMGEADTGPGQIVVRPQPMPNWVWGLVCLYLDNLSKPKSANPNVKLEVLTTPNEQSLQRGGDQWRWEDAQGPQQVPVPSSGCHEEAPNDRQPPAQEANAYPGSALPASKRLRADSGRSVHDQAQVEKKTAEGVAEGDDGDVARRHRGHYDAMGSPAAKHTAKGSAAADIWGRGDGDQDMAEELDQMMAKGMDMDIDADRDPEERMIAAGEETADPQEGGAKAMAVPAPEPMTAASAGHAANAAPALPGPSGIAPEAPRQTDTEEAPPTDAEAMGDGRAAEPSNPAVPPPTSMPSASPLPTATGNGDAPPVAPQEDDSDEDSDSHLLIMKGADSDDSD